MNSVADVSRPDSGGGRTNAADEVVPPTIIRPESDRWLPDLKEVWRFRHLIRALINRNVRVRYKNTALGAFWIMLQPLLQMAVYTLIFGLWARIPVGDIPFAVHVISGIVLLFFLNRVISESANAVRANQALTRKVYFPKLVLPIVISGSALADLAVATLVMAVIMALFGIAPAMTVLLAPAFLLLLLAWAFSLGLWFTALGIRFRDLTLLIPVITMLMMYLSPVIYPLTIVPEQFLPIYALNPMVGILTGWRWAVIGLEPFYPWMVAISVAEIAVIGITGMLYFTRTERNFNDYI
jgi:lipopolysaccharide transport system permease protein